MNQITVASVKGSLAGTFEPAYRPFIRDIFGVDTIDKRRVYGEFYRQYEGIVLKALRKHNKFTRNFEDLVGRVWLDFTGNTSGIGLLEKFFVQAIDSQPDLGATMTGTEVAAKLNITFEAWHAANDDHTKVRLVGGKFLLDEEGTVFLKQPSKRPSFPQPVEGSYAQPEALYVRSDVLEWYEEFDEYRANHPNGDDEDDDLDDVIIAAMAPKVVPKADEWILQVDAPRATPKHFLNYLKKSILHRFVNFCRTEERRHKERVWDTFTDQLGDFENSPSWEDRQEASSDQEESAEISLLIRRLKATPAAPHIEQILTSMYDDRKAEGKYVTIYDAIERCGGMSETDKRATVRGVRGYRPGAGQLRPHVAA